MNGKGDAPRPLSVPRKTFEANWDLAFGQKQRDDMKHAECLKHEHPELFEDATPFCERSNFDEILGIMYGKHRK